MFGLPSSSAFFPLFHSYRPRPRFMVSVALWLTALNQMWRCEIVLELFVGALWARTQPKAVTPPRVTVTTSSAERSRPPWVLLCLTINRPILAQTQYRQPQLQWAVIALAVLCSGDGVPQSFSLPYILLFGLCFLIDVWFTCSEMGS